MDGPFSSSQSHIPEKKSIFKKWWFWVIIAVVILVILFAFLIIGMAIFFTMTFSTGGGEQSSGPFSAFVFPPATIDKCPSYSSVSKRKDCYRHFARENPSIEKCEPVRSDFTSDLDLCYYQMALFSADSSPCELISPNIIENFESLKDLCFSTVARANGSTNRMENCIKIVNTEKKDSCISYVKDRGETCGEDIAQTTAQQYMDSLIEDDYDKFAEVARDDCLAIPALCINKFESDKPKAQAYSNIKFKNVGIGDGASLPVDFAVILNGQNRTVSLDAVKKYDLTGCRIVQTVWGT